MNEAANGKSHYGSASCNTGSGGLQQAVKPVCTYFPMCIQSKITWGLN